MTLPTPILVAKSPRPTELSNLFVVMSNAVGNDIEYSLVAAIVLSFIVVQPSRVLDGDGIAVFRIIGFVTLLDKLFLKLGRHGV